jgi:uncharacterized membrane protein
MLVAAEMLRRNGGGLPAALLQALGLAVAAFFVALEIRHFANGGVLLAGVPGLGEQSALTMAALAFSLGLQRIARETGDPVYHGASLLAGVLGAAQIALAHFITANPLFTNENVGEGFSSTFCWPVICCPQSSPRGLRRRPAAFVPARSCCSLPASLWRLPSPTSR